MRRLKTLSFFSILLIVICWIINAYIVVKTKHYIIRGSEPVSEVEAVLIPGASVYRSGELSPVLKQRVEVGIRFAYRNPGVKMILSGYAIPNGYNEPAAMAEFAESRLVSPDRIIQDFNGTSTYATLINCKKVYKVNSVLIVTQEYHLPRALYIAHSLGLQAYGQIAPSNMPVGRKYLREYFSRLKDFFLLKIFKLFHKRSN
jgi:vancomycin permeability regulator SanA